MSPQGPRPVEVRRVQNAPDLLQGQAHLPVEQNLLQPLHLSGPVEAVVVVPVPPWYREEPVLVTLPQNYQGKTLTIAQSTDSFGGELQEPSTTVWPCGVTLYCGYAYESALVAESFQTAIPAALTFAAGTLLLALFLWQAFQGRLALDALCSGLTAFLWLAGRLALTFLPNAQLGPLPVDVAILARNLSLTLLLVFLASRLTGRRRKVVGLLAYVIRNFR